MSVWLFPPETGLSKGRRILFLMSVAVVCLLTGVLIASNLDFTAPTVAQRHSDYSALAALPVVEADEGPESPFVAVVENAEAAVVHVSARSRVNDLPWWHRGPGYSTSSGSGFFFSGLRGLAGFLAGLVRLLDCLALLARLASAAR